MEDEDEAFQLMCTLKAQIIVDERLADDYDEILRDLFTLMNENTSILRHLERSNFITETLLLTLKFSRSYDLGLQFITEMINMGAKIPVYFYSKNFVFFVTEKLFEQMDDSSTNLDFVLTLIKLDRRFINSFEECGYFVLANSLITEQCCKLYSQIFKGYEERVSIKECDQEKSQRNQIDINEDVLFEVQRKNFDSEIVFREAGLVVFKKRKGTFKKGDALLDKLFVNLYKANLYKLLDLSFEDTIDILSYRAIKCDWLLDNNLFIEQVFNGNLSALRVLKNIIADCGKNGLLKLEEIGYLPKIAKLLENKSDKVLFESVMGLCTFLSRKPCENYSCFTEKRIRAIFSLLEYSCEDCACGYKLCILKSDLNSDSLISETHSKENSFIEKHSTVDLTHEPNTPSISCVDKHNTINPTLEPSSLGISFSEVVCSSTKGFTNNTLFPSDMTQPQNHQPINVKCLEKCETMKVLELLFKIYANHKKAYFYKISYVILLKTISDCLYHHNCFNKDIFQVFFSEFITFVISRDKNISRILFMFQNKKTTKSKNAVSSEEPNEDNIFNFEQ